MSPYCHVDYGILTQARGLGSYVIPKIDVQVSGVFQSKPGALLVANYAVPGSVIAQALGRPAAGNPANVTINLLAPGEQYGDRLNQLDFRFAKILRFGHTRTMIGLDLYNALNSERDPDLQRRIHSGRIVEPADHRPDGEAGEDQRGDHVLDAERREVSTKARTPFREPLRSFMSA